MFDLLVGNLDVFPIVDFLHSDPSLLQGWKRAKREKPPVVCLGT